MNVKNISRWIIGAAALCAASQASADTSVTRSESTRVESESTSGGMGDPAQLGSRHSEYTREESRSNTMPPAIGTRSETVTTTTERKFNGYVRRLEPNRAVVVVDGTEYAVSGPYVAEIIKRPDQRVIITGSLNEPTKTIDITRYEWVQ